jgi:two-component system, OmpR family, response regulator RegX3
MAVGFLRSSTHLRIPGAPPRSSMERILLVEDEAVIAETVALNLREEGYDVTVAPRGDEGLSRARGERFDLLILDLMLPGLSGLEICKAVRQHSRVPILILTARSREVDKVVALEVGADDYLTKPFGMLELVARVKALLRRARAAPAALPTEPEEVHRVGGVTLDVSRHRVTRDGAVVTLRPRQFELLRVLLANRGRVVPHPRLLELVWGDEEGPEIGTLHVHIRWLREVLEPDPARPRRILTVRGVGYQYAEDEP